MEQLSELYDELLQGFDHLESMVMRADRHSKTKARFFRYLFKKKANPNNT